MPPRAKRTLALAALLVALSLQLPSCRRAPTPELDGTLFGHQVVDAHGPKDPWGKSIGDINGDGRIDLIVGGRAGGGLVWYENPSWRKHVVSPEGPFSTDHEVADIDGDGNNDIVCLLVTGLVWFKNPGWKMTWIDRERLHDIEIADLNKDGRPDIVARGQSAFGGGGNKVFIYLQDERLHWARYAIDVPAGEGLAIADIDGDGFIDIVINGVWLRNPGGGDTAWAAHRYTSSWTWPHTAIALHDLNHDGRIDIVLAPAELAGTRFRISWFEAPADRRNEWREHVVDADVETVHHFVAVADVDLDGRPDVLSAAMHQGRAPREVKVYLNLGGEAWEKRLLATTGSHNMRVGDLDGDGDPDLFGANWSGAHQPVEIWVNQTCAPDGGCARWRRHVIDADRPGKAVFVLAADLDGDGQIDVAGGRWWYRNPGALRRSWSRHAFGALANDVVLLADLDGDGDIDAFATRWTEGKPDAGFVFAENSGGGRFRVHPLTATGAGDFLQGVAAARFRQSGRLQIAMSWHAAGKGIQLLTVPDDPFASDWPIATISSVSQDEALTAADIDRDGLIDLLLGTAWLRNEADGSWSLFQIDAARRNPDRNRLADINRDGRLDAVVGFEAISRPGDIVWYEQGPDPTNAWQPHLIGNVTGPMSIGVGDVDGDGDEDVVVGEHDLERPASARLLMFENVDGRGRVWHEHLVHRGDEHHDGALLVDLDGDGDLDIVSVGWGHGKVVWYENLHRSRARP